MTTVSTQALLLAALTADAGSELAGGLDRETSSMWPGLLIAGGMLLGIAVVWGAVFLALRWRASASISPPTTRLLWERLAGVHALNAGDVQQLRTLLKGPTLLDPAVVFLDPRVLERFATEHPTQADWATQMGQKLFGDLYQSTGIVKVDEQTGIG